MMQRSPRRPWYQTQLAFNLAAGLLLWAAFPPLNCWPLAWVAPWFWFALIDRNLHQPTATDVTASQSRLKKWFQRFDHSAWLAACLHWLLLLQGLRLAHWGTHFGWVALSMYLALYIPCFLALTSKLVERWRLPLGVAAAISWTVLEWIRGHMLSGFSFGLLAHTQADHLPLIQVADFSGAYGVSFLVMLVSGLVYRCGPWNLQNVHRWRLGPALASLLVLAVTISYGLFRLSENQVDPASRTLQVGLIQGSIDTQFGDHATPDSETFQLYNDLTLQLRMNHPDVDLVVWPESMFSYLGPELLIDPNSVAPANSDMEPKEFRRWAESYNERFYQHTASFARHVNQLPTNEGSKELDIHFILGSNCTKLPPDEAHYNSAILVDANGVVQNRYFKMHRVVFGEYVPGGQWFPWLYQLTPMPTGITAGKQPVAFHLQTKQFQQGEQVVTSWTVVPNICFESAVPHLIRRQVQDLRSQGDPPDALVTITNDGWFWQSSMLDLHLLCGVFRAVENRLPMLTAANTGLSAWIDPAGKIQQRGPRRLPQQRENGTILARIPKSKPQLSGYQRWGDWPWAILCLAALLASFWPRRMRPKS